MNHQPYPTDSSISVQIKCVCLDPGRLRRQQGQRRVRVLSIRPWQSRWCPTVAIGNGRFTSAPIGRLAQIAAIARWHGGRMNPVRSGRFLCAAVAGVSQLTSPSCPKGAPAGYPPACSHIENGRDTWHRVIEGSTKCGFQNPSRLPGCFTNSSGAGPSRFQ
jgi:hypothetical protein